MTGAVHRETLGAHVQVLTIDNPPMNPMGQAMREQFMAALDEAEASAEVRCLVITGKGKAFCAGDDLKNEPAKGGPAGFAALLQRMDAAKIPIVAAVNGWCIGGGFELALACDIRLASSEAKFTAAGVNMGLMASAYRLPRLIGVSRAKAMLLTGEPVDAPTAERYGLVTGLYGPEGLMPAAIRLAERIASRAPLSVEATKRVAGRAVDMNPGEASAMQDQILSILRASEDHAEAVAAFREKREPVFSRR